MNRFRIFDVLESRWLHIGYDTPLLGESGSEADKESRWGR
jgi:hypothetical protein